MRVFVTGLVALAFLSGFLIAVANIWPTIPLRDSLKDVQTYLEQQILDGGAHPLSQPANDASTGLVSRDPARSAPGYTMVQTTTAEGHEMQLLDHGGALVARWPVSFRDFWPDAADHTHIDPGTLVPSSTDAYHLQGFVAEPDGSVVVVLSHRGAVKLDRCGAVDWRLDRMVHHAVSHDGQGGYLFADRIPPDEIPEAYIPARTSMEELREAIARYGDGLLQGILEVDSDGNPGRFIPILPALIAGGRGFEVAASMNGQPFDPVHLNDIDVVTAPLARQIDGVEAGDFLVSLRSLHMLAILDRETGAYRWSQTGPWGHQHDPDIAPDGRIEVFNNNFLNGTRFPPALGFVGSEIVQFDPASGASEVIHPVGSQDTFRSRIMGTHQRLSNGNRLIVQTEGGRIFEVTPGGDVVWDYVVAYGADRIAPAYHAERFASDFFDTPPEDWSCSE